MMRRFFMLAFACASLVACGGGQSSNAPLPGAPAAPAMMLDGAAKNQFPEPPVVRPIHHVATVSLVAKLNPANEMPAFYFDGQPNVAPTVRVDPGDTIVMDVANELAGPTRRGDLNLHFHGLTVSPNPPADDVITTLALPGGTLHYVIPIPKTQEPGLYWYHPHVFPTTDFQVGEAGMSGAIVIEGLQRHLRRLAKMTERLMIVRDIGAGDTDSRKLPHLVGKAACGPDPGLTLTVNGVVHPTIEIARGEHQFFRIVNATAHKNLRLGVDGGKLQLVAIDGFALDTYPGTPPTKTVEDVVVPPAARAEFVVIGTGNVEAKFRTLCYDSGPTGDPDPRDVLAALRPPPNGSRRTLLPAPGDLGAAAPLPVNAYTQPLPAPVEDRQVVLSEDDKRMYINGKSFKMMDAPMFVAHVGTVEKWEIVNVTGEVHDFHIHQIHFAVKAIDGVKLAHPYWADSIVVPHEKHGIPGTLTLLMDFRDPVIQGTFMFHCHILDHEDAGMMAKIQVI